MKRLFSLFLILFTIVLTGCGTALPAKEVVQKETIRVIRIPDKLLVPCKATEPIKPDDFIILKPEDKESALSDLAISLYKDLGNCNSQIKEIADYQTRESKIIEETKK